MGFTSVFRIDGRLSLRELEGRLRNIEETSGALIAIGLLEGDVNTWATHAAGGEAPATPLKLLQFDGEPPAPPSGEAVCFGDCFIGGRQKMVLAYREGQA